MTREEAIEMLKEMKSEECYKALIDLCDMAISALQEPQLDVYAQEYKAYRDAHPYGTYKVTEPSEQVTSKLKNPCDSLLTEDSAKSKEQKSKLEPTKDCTDFLCWLLEEIMDEENWEINAEADGEIIARKLKKLGLLDSKDGYYIRTPMYEALTEPSDLISRAEAIKALSEFYEYSIRMVDEITDLLNSLPSVSAERVGEWQYEKMVMPLSNHTKDSYRCSVCHTHWDCETNYCPNCGARMENK